MASTSIESVESQPKYIYTWWYGLRFGFPGVLLQDHGKVISKSHQGQILFTWEVYGD